MFPDIDTDANFNVLELDRHYFRKGWQVTDIKPPSTYFR